MLEERRRNRRFLRASWDVSEVCFQVLTTGFSLLEHQSQRPQCCDTEGESRNDKVS